MTNTNILTLPFTEVAVFDETELLNLLGDVVVLHISETLENGETDEARVAGTVEIVTLLEGGVALKLVGSPDPISVAEEELGNVTLSVTNRGQF